MNTYLEVIETRPARLTHRQDVTGWAADRIAARVEELQAEHGCRFHVNVKTTNVVLAEIKTKEA